MNKTFPDINRMRTWMASCSGFGPPVPACERSPVWLRPRGSESLGAWHNRPFYFAPTRISIFRTVSRICGASTPFSYAASSRTSRSMKPPMITAGGLDLPGKATSQISKSFPLEDFVAGNKSVERISPRRQRGPQDYLEVVRVSVRSGSLARRPETRSQSGPALLHT